MSADSTLRELGNLMLRPRYVIGPYLGQARTAADMVGSGPSERPSQLVPELAFVRGEDDAAADRRYPR